MLNHAGRIFLIVLLAPLLCIGVLVMFVVALCDFSASRIKGHFARIETPKGHEAVIDLDRNAEPQ
jgi:hypothetical protein